MPELTLDEPGMWAIAAAAALVMVVAGTRVFRATKERDFRRFVPWLLPGLSGMAMVGN